MREITQTILADPRRGDGHDATGTPGDCFRACLAMLADVRLRDAPHAVLYRSWFSVARLFIRAHIPGTDLQCFDWDGTFDLYGDGLDRIVIATGPSPRGDFKHCVMANAATGEVMFDPHPSRAGLLKIELADALVPADAPGNLPIEPFPVLMAGAA